MNKMNLPWGILLIFRIGISFLMQTQHVPDEYWQSLEVAYHQVYGKGTLTWEWGSALRASLHAQIFSAIFLILKTFGIDTPYLIWAAPRVLQGGMCFLIDVGTYAVTVEHYGARAAGRTIGSVALTLMVGSWFHAYTGCRTLVNAFEACLTVWAMYFYLRLKNRQNVSSYACFIMLVGVATAARVTSVVLWLPLLPGAVFASRQRVATTLLAVVACVALLLATDRVFYGEWVFTPWAFVRFNFLDGHSALFGTHPFHWYWTQSMPVMLGLSYALFLYYPCVRGAPCLLWSLTVYYAVAFSFIGHKEFRFLYPVMPLATACAAYTLSQIPRRFSRALLNVILFANTIAAIALCGVHQRGTLQALAHIRSHQCEGSVDTLDVWMGCHQTPGYSYVHGCVRQMNYIDCPVELDTDGHRKPTPHHVFGQYPKQYLEWAYAGLSDEHGDPRALAAVKSVALPSSRPLPSHILLYEDLSLVMMPFLTSRGYRVQGEWYHTFLPLEESTGNHVVLMGRPK